MYVTKTHTFFFFNLKNFFFYFLPHHAACGILTPRPGIEPISPAVEAQSPNHWTTRELPTHTYFLNKTIYKIRFCSEI